MCWCVYTGMYLDDLDIIAPPPSSSSSSSSLLRPPRHRIIAPPPSSSSSSSSLLRPLVIVLLLHLPRHRRHRHRYKQHQHQHQRRPYHDSVLAALVAIATTAPSATRSSLRPACRSVSSAGLDSSPSALHL